MDELQFRLKELELRAEIAKINAEKEIEIKKLEGFTIFYYLYSSY